MQEVYTPQYTIAHNQDDPHQRYTFDFSITETSLSYSTDFFCNQMDRDARNNAMPLFLWHMSQPSRLNVRGEY